jgi:hypothetical protein
MPAFVEADTKQQKVFGIFLSQMSFPLTRARPADNLLEHHPGSIVGTFIKIILRGELSFREDDDDAVLPGAALAHSALQRSELMELLPENNVR